MKGSPARSTRSIWLRPARRCLAGSAIHSFSSGRRRVTNPSVSPRAGRRKAMSTELSVRASSNRDVVCSTSLIERSGCRSRNRPMMRGTIGLKDAELVNPIDNPPISPRAARFAAVAACSAAAMAPWACGMNASPASVSSTPRVSLWNSCTPSSCSSSLICWLKGGWPIPNRWAARVKWRSSAMASAYRKCLSSISKSNRKRLLPLLDGIAPRGYHLLEGCCDNALPSDRRVK